MNKEMFEKYGQSIETAPKDGSVVFSDDGTVTFEYGRWYSCDGSGSIFSCAEDGISISVADPVVWIDLEEILK